LSFGILSSHHPPGDQREADRQASWTDLHQVCQAIRARSGDSIGGNIHQITSPILNEITLNFSHRLPIHFSFMQKQLGPSARVRSQFGAA
jgi:hypothetical protein